MDTVDELEYFCKEENMFGALMFTGKWGCGKTYLIENQLSNKLGDQYIILRISLFGESCIESVHLKVQKAYFQEVMLNMGGNIEQLVSEIPCVSASRASKMGNSVEKATGTVTDLTDRFLKSKIGKVFQFAAGMVKNIPGIEKVLALNPSDWMTIEESIAGKKVILVFDDMERCILNEIDILGCINEYSENKGIKTIIIANEEKLIENIQLQGNAVADDQKDVKSIQKNIKINYSEMKEKIIVRTIKNIPNYRIIIDTILSDYKTGNTEYKKFLLEHNTELANVFMCGKSENIRSIKCTIQDFERVYKELVKNNIKDEISDFFQTFSAFTLSAKAGLINKSEDYGYLFCDSAIEKEYPGYYKRSFMLPSFREWVVDGVWNKDNISSDIRKMLERQKEHEPEVLVRIMRLMDLEEDIIEKGLPNLLEIAYSGLLDIEEYVFLIGNINWARSIGYELPQLPDMDKLEKGLDECLKTIQESDEYKNRITRVISNDEMKTMTSEEKRLYEKICFFRDNEIQMFAINERKYLEALQKHDMHSLAVYVSKRFNIFDKEISDKVLSCYRELKNADRNYFIDLFRDTWRLRLGAQDIQFDESIDNFMELKKALEELKCEEDKENYRLKATYTQNFINVVVEVIEKLNECIPTCKNKQAK